MDLWEAVGIPVDHIMDGKFDEGLTVQWALADPYTTLTQEGDDNGCQASKEEG